MQTLRHRGRSAVESFWFVPALLLLAAVVLAQVMVGLDQALVGRGIAELPFVSSIGASGSRDLLSAIGGSMLGVAATSFSITISVIATASSTYGPRLVRNFMANRGNQIVLGTFGATFLYALLVLRTVREEAGTTTAFVPHLAVTVAILLAVLDVVVLIYFIHHIADSIQVSTLASQVLDDLERSSDGAEPFPTRTVGATELDATAVVHTVRAERHGYLQHVDRASLVELAARYDGVLELVLPVGDHVIIGDPVARFRGPADTDTEAIDKLVRRHLTSGTSRTPHQDLRYAAQQIVEMAVRALSPSTNDPYTAINAINELSTGLARLVARGDHGNGYLRDGELRLVEVAVPTVEVIDLVLNQLRPCSATWPDVVLALLDLRTILIDRTSDPVVRRHLDRQLTSLVRAFVASEPDEIDLERVRARAGALLPQPSNTL